MRLGPHLRQASQRGLHRMGLSSVAWRLGLDEERRFWDEYLATGGLHWPEEFARRTSPDTELEPAVEARLATVTDRVPRVLDVGSGPLTALGRRPGGEPMDLVAIDPLADWYGTLYRRHGLEPRVRPRSGRAEEVAALYPDGHFDLVFCRNALDHGVDPVRGIDQMLAVTRPGGWVHLEHAEREGANQHYRGLHQWDLEEVDGRLVVGHRERTTDVTVRLAGRATVVAETDAEGWVRAWITRT
jgi:SAM-dependent methyltransferase